MRLVPLLSLNLTILCMTGCGASYRTANITASHVTANTSVQHKQMNEAPVVSLPSELCRNEWGGKYGNIHRLSFVEQSENLTGPDSEAFVAGMNEVKSIREDTPAMERARILTKAGGHFRQAVSLASNDDVRDAANINLAVASAALGDWGAYRNAIAKLPERKSYPRNLDPFVNLLLLPVHIVAFVVTLGNYGEEDPFNTVVNNVRNVDSDALVAPSVRQNVVVRENEITKVSAAAIAPTFHYDDATTQVRQFPDLIVSIDYDVDKIGITDLRVVFTNQSQRVVNIGNMAARIVQKGAGKKTNDIKIVEAEARALPQEKAVVHFSLEGKANWQNVFEKASEYTLTIYDVPVAFDALGAVSKKDNITWNFSFTPGSREQRVRDEEKSTRTTTWWTFTPGYKLVK